MNTYFVVKENRKCLICPNIFTVLITSTQKCCGDTCGMIQAGNTKKGMHWIKKATEAKMKEEKEIIESHRKVFMDTEEGNQGEII